MKPSHANTGSTLKASYQSTGRLCYKHSQYLFQYIGIKNIRVNGRWDRFLILIFSLPPQAGSMDAIEDWPKPKISIK